MPKIQWTGLPPALRDHLFDRLRERRITAEDLYQLKLWRESDPEAPDGLSFEERMVLALRLGERGLEVFRQATGLEREAAIRELQRQRQATRTPSQAMADLIG
jgi:hypothetical protein